MQVAACLGAAGDLGGDRQRLLVLAAVEEQLGRSGGHHVGHFGEAAGQCELDPRPQHLQCVSGAFVAPKGDSEVVVQDGDLASLSALGGEPDRLAEVVEPTPVTEQAAGHSPVAEGACRAGKAEPLGQGERLFGVAQAGLASSLQRLGTGG